MSQSATLPVPADLADEMFDALQAKATTRPRAIAWLGVLAGVYIGLGGLFATVALAGAATLPFGVSQLLAGFVFALGLALVIIAGAELFTGNMLFAGCVATGRVPLGTAARALAIAYVANFVGSLLLAALVLAAGLHEAGDGAIGLAAIELGEGKLDKGFAATLASGILANMLVCLGVWLAAAGRTVTQKISGLILPVAAFVAAGLEHSVANMYLLPYAWMVQQATGQGTDAMALAPILANLVPATLGNMLGGAAVALAYWRAYRL